MKPLTGKVVLITGASRGLGVDMARAFAGKGARLALAARSAEDLESVRKELGSEAIAVVADLRDLGSLRSLVTTVESSLGPVDVLVNNAGLEQVCDFESMDLDQMKAIIDTNVTGLLWLSRLIVPSMVARRSGHIVNIASLAGLNPVPHNTVYSASKHAVVGFSLSLRAELEEHGVEVSVVCPSFVTAGMFAEWGRPAPKAVGAVDSPSVAKGVIEAVEKNKPLVTVAKGLGKIGHASFALAPGLALGTMKKTGVVRYMREQAEINAKRG
ncbi:MAG TPA: SDR family oxidoreductase [Actinomycetota bacterium]|nr:SDR family oxidoreductase [Actinomycetota bacterium]